MEELKKIFNLTSWLLIGFLCFPVTESKSQVKEMSAKDLTTGSTAVLYGKCSKIESKWNDKKSIIFTYITVVPEAYMKGNLGTQVVITIPGGQVGNILYEVSEMPVFVQGEDIVAFIWTNPAGKNLVTGGAQGKMKIEKDAKTGKRMVHTSGIIIDGDTQNQPTAKAVKPEKMQLEDFVTRVKGYTKN